MTESKKESIEVKVETKQPIKKELPKLTAYQAWNAIAGNKRLSTFISKKFSGVKGLEDWKKEFEKEGMQ
jgi:hypothetical protein